MRRADAPPAGWYPDPSGRSGLLWWDGSDWSRHHRRPAPVATWHGGVEEPSSTPAEAPTPPGPQATREHLQQRTVAARRRAEGDAAEVVAEARRAARAEVDRAVAQATRQITTARDQWQPRIDRFVRRLKRWSRILVIVVVAFVALSTWASATLQTSLLEWLGERVDAITAVAVAPGDAGADPLTRAMPERPWSADRRTSGEWTGGTDDRSR